MLRPLSEPDTRSSILLVDELDAALECLVNALAPITAL
jgi:hypothetical protein